MSRLVVADAGFSWTRALFGALPGQTQQLWLMPRNWSQRRAPRPATPPHVAVEPYGLPPGWFSRYPWPFHARMARDARRFLGSVGDRTLVLTYPQYLPIAKRVPGARVVYYWSDEFRHYRPGQEEQVAKVERAMVRRADLTITASYTKADDLAKEVPEAAGRIRPLVHGHHPSLLPAAPRLEPAPLPQDLAHLPRPVLGHWGQVSSHMDARIVEALARAFPQGSVVLVGPTQENFEGEQAAAWARVKAMPNVHRVGARPYERIAEHVPAFDVCLSLYRPDVPFTRVTNPSKIRDYLASTRPIVATPVPDVERSWPGLFETAREPEAFVDAVRRALTEDPKRAEARLAYAREHTWEQVASRLARMIEGAQR